jgi:predicted exporter
MKRYQYFILAALMIAFLALCHSAGAQSQTFTLLRLSDGHGLETRQEVTKITLLTGEIEITEGGQTFREKVLTQTKGTTYTRVTTNSGEYTLLFDGPVLYAVHLRSVIGADRSYLNPLKNT